jgi:hypothetical protein
MKSLFSKINFWQAYGIALAPQIAWIILVILSIKLNLINSSTLNLISNPVVVDLFETVRKSIVIIYFGIVLFVFCLFLFRKEYKNVIGIVIGFILGLAIYSIAPIIILGFTLGVGTE